MKTLFIPALFLLLQTCHSANILALMPFPSRSHSILLERLLRELSNKGHSVTYLSGVKPSKALGNVTILQLSNSMEKLMEARGGGNTMMFKGLSPLTSMPFLAYMGLTISGMAFESEHGQALLNSREKFDLIIADNFLQESLIAGFSYKFQAPIIAVHPSVQNTWANYLTGNPAPSSFIPEPFVGTPTKMTFLERTLSFVAGVAFEMFHHFIYLPQHDAIIKKYIGQDTPPIHQILKNTSLVLINYHFGLSYPRPLLPNMVEIGGMHIDDPKPLPIDLQDYMDNSKDGVILFSLGSNIKSADLPLELRKEIIQAFSKMKQNVLWKFEEKISDLPKNVRVMQWLPQSDILAHPNLKLFITHGGLLSTTESAQRGVPVVGIPFMADQPINMREIEKAGYGKTLEFDDITEKSFYDTITEVISNPTYKETALKKKSLLQDNPQRPLESALWWIEYVLRHNGAKHLRSAAQNLSWHQYYLLDVHVFLGAIALVIVVVNIYILKFIIKKIFGRKCTTKEEKQKQKKEN